MQLADRVLVLAGRGRYADPWHDHAATSHEVALAVSDLVGGVEVRGTFPTPPDFGDFALVIVNAGRGRSDPDYDGDDGDWAAYHEALRRYAVEGGAVLGLHQAANAFADSPYWQGILGGRWVPGVSYHPAFGESVFEVVRGHPVVDGLAEVRAMDERYCDLERVPSAVSLLSHREAGVEHPVVWVQDDGVRRSAYDALGHGVESYRSASRRRLLRREVAWLLGASAERVVGL